MLEKILVSLPTSLLTAKKHKKYRSLRVFLCQSTRQLQHGHATGSIVIGAVVNLVAIYGLAHTHVVHVRGEQNDLIFQLVIAALDDANDIARTPLLFTFTKKVKFTGDILNVAAFVPG